MVAIKNIFLFAATAIAAAVPSEPGSKLIYSDLIALDDSVLALKKNIENYTGGLVTAGPILVYVMTPFKIFPGPDLEMRKLRLLRPNVAFILTPHQRRNSRPPRQPQSLHRLPTHPQRHSSRLQNHCRLRQQRDRQGYPRHRRCPREQESAV